MNPNIFLNDWLEVMFEACEGGNPGQGTAFLDGTKADGSGNNGLFATLELLSATQASDPTLLGLSVAAHTAHTAYHMEVGVRWMAGDHGPFDWQGSFDPRAVDETEWNTLKARVRTAYDALVQLNKSVTEWNDDSLGGLSGALAHVCYHLGAIRQTVKLLG